MNEMASGAAFTSEVVLHFLVFMLAAILAMALARRERRHVAALFSLYVLSLGLRGLTLVLGSLSMLTSSRTVEFISLLIQGVAVLNLVTLFLFEILLQAVRIVAPRILRDLTNGMVAIGLTLYLFSQYHLDVSGIVATSAVITAVVGFSLQDVLVNVMGGIALQLDRSIEPGDWVQYGDQVGKVREVSWRFTALEKRNGDTYIIPNGVLMRNPFLLRGKRPEGGIKGRRWIYFGVDYRVTPANVIETVNTALTREPMPYVAEEPAPRTLLVEFKESWAQYGVQYWLLDMAQDDPTDSVVRARIYYGLKRAGIPLSIPAAMIFTEATDAQERLVRHSERDQAARIKALESVPIFASLTAEERAALARNLVYAPFIAGEAMVVQGRAVHHLYIMTAGEADVRVSVAGAPPRIVSRLCAPDFFGEMGMLTGEPRKATVIAATEVQCWRLEKEKFQDIMERRPQLADEISKVLAERQVNLVVAREGLSEEARRSRIQSEHSSLTEKIRVFFGLE